jgi:hypothetical protein
MWLMVIVTGVVLFIAATYEKTERVPGTLEKKTTVHPGVIFVLLVVFVLFLLGAIGAFGPSTGQPTQPSNTLPVQVGK